MTDNELEYRTVSQCISSDYTRGWNDATKEAEKLVAIKNAEIERLTINMNAFGLGMKREAERADTARAEAIREFAERLKARMDDFAKVENGNGDYYFLIGKSLVDETAEEMAGEKK